MLFKKSTLLYSIFTLVFAGFVIFTVPLFAQKNTRNKPLPLEDVQRFTNALSYIKNYYVEPVPDQQLFDDAIRGMLNGLDPHSTYLDKDEFRQMTSNAYGEFAGLGLEITRENGLIKVVTPMDDTPAAKAGIKPGDLIVRIDDMPIKDMTLTEAVNKMRGEKGTMVSLTIVREGEEKPLFMHIKRDVIKIQSIKYKMLDGGFAYIRLSQFQAPSAKDLAQAIKILQAQSGGHLKGLILDLRNNPGGLLDSAVAVSDMFLDSNKLGKNKKIVYAEGRIPEAYFSAQATPGDVLNGAPMVVMINEGSASGSEIVAGALQDHKRALLIGSQTFGKGSVQTVLPLDKATGIKLTTALYYTPNGHSIQAKGIEPDILSKPREILKPQDDPIKPVHESQLNGYLEKKPASPSQAQAGKSVSEDLIYEDYPLYEALNVLKAQVFMRNQWVGHHRS